MKTTKMIILVGVITFALANSGSGLYAQPSRPYYYDAPSYGPVPNRNYLPPPNGKVYLGCDIGLAFQQVVTLKNTFGEGGKVAFDPGIRFDFQAGYNFTTNWAAEMELGLIINQAKNSAVLGTDFMEVDLVEPPIMVNVIYTRSLGHGFSAYIGSGIGGCLQRL